MTNQDTLPSSALHNLAPTEHSEIELVPGRPEYLSPDLSLAGPEENRISWGIGFSAELRAIIQLSPRKDGEAVENLYIFDQGEQALGGGVADLDPSKTNILIRPTDRFIVFTESGIKGIIEAVENDQSVKTRAGWKAFQPGTATRIGRGNETLNSELAGEVSSGHVDIDFAEDGTISVTDIHSTNGTRLISPTQPKTQNRLETALDTASTQVEKVDNGREILLGKNVISVEGAISLPRGDKYYVLNSRDKYGVQRQFIVYRSQSQGGLRVSQGRETEDKRILKGGESGRKGVDHYTQETQLHPLLEAYIQQQQSMELTEIDRGDVAIFNLSIEKAARAKIDFAAEVKIRDFPDAELYKELWKVRAGELSAEEFASRMGLAKGASLEVVQKSLMEQVGRINALLEKSDVIPSFYGSPDRTVEDIHPVLGKIIKQTFGVSKDGRVYEWTMASTTDGQHVWIDRIRLADSTPSSYGTDSEIVDSAFLTSKPIEYTTQTEAIPDSLKIEMDGDYTEITSFLALLEPIKRYKKIRLGQTT